MERLFTSKEAKEYAQEGKLEEWIHLFLCNEGNNIPFSEGLKLEKRTYFGPLKMPLSIFTRCCGPEDNMKYKINEAGFLWRVSEICKRINNGWDMPPLIINYSKGVFELNDGNHRYQAMLDCGIKDTKVIIWTTGDEDKHQFCDNYSVFLKISKLSY